MNMIKVLKLNNLNSSLEKKNASFQHFFLTSLSSQIIERHNKSTIFTINSYDLYFKNNNEWQYINTGRPTGFNNEYRLVDNMSNELREYKIFLPLYDGLKKIEIGIDKSRQKKILEDLEALCKNH